jgi:hypothetical protein
MGERFGKKQGIGPKIEGQCWNCQNIVAKYSNRKRKTNNRRPPNCLTSSSGSRGRPRQECAFEFGWDKTEKVTRKKGTWSDSWCSSHIFMNAPVSVDFGLGDEKGEGFCPRQIFGRVRTDERRREEIIGGRR